MSESFAGQVVLVTGAVQGIGAGIAEHFASCGAITAIVDIDSDRGRQAERRFKKRGLHITFRECDLREPSAVSALVEKVWSEEGHIDILVNNAADHGPRRSLLEYSLEDWQSVLATNLTGTFWLTREVVRRMIAGGISGNIVNILAIQSQIPIPTYSAYVASKGGLEALTRAMAVEFAPHHIRANGVMLGAIYSGSTSSAAGSAARSDIDFEQVPPTMDRNVPNLVGRMGRPSDVARVVAMLASSESSYLTGSVMLVDGGRLVNRGADAFSQAAERKREASR
jgi:NAD(P)-dependent dehydrogenase (short-subunit alcohol dehydrogenase family)